MTVVLLFIDPVLALISLTTAPLLVVISFVFRRKVRERARKQRRHEGDLASVANEALSRDGRREGLRRRGARGRAGPQPQRAAHGRRRRGRAAAGPLRRHRRRAARLRHRARDRLRRLPRGQGRAERRRPDRLRQLHPQGLEPDAQLRPRGEQADRGARPRRPDRRDPLRPTTSSTRSRTPTAAPRATGAIELDARLLRVRRRARRAARRQPHPPRRPAARADRPVRRRASRRSPALVARFYDPTEGARHARRPRRPRLLAGLAARPDRGRPAGHGPLLRLRPREHRLRHGRRPARDRRRRQGGRRARVHRGPPRGLRHRARPPGRGPLRRPAPAHRDRPHAAAQPAGDHPRRAHHRARQGQRGPGARRPRPPDARPHVPARSRTRRGSPGPRTRSSNSITDGSSRRRSTLARAVVTGCAGFIGSHLIEPLLAGRARRPRRRLLQRQLRARRQAREPQRRGRLRDASGCSTADLVNVDADALLDGADVVYHLAGEPGVRASWGPRFDRYTHHNVQATQRLLEAARGTAPALRLRVVELASTATRSSSPRTRTRRRARSPPTA